MMGAFFVYILKSSFCLMLFYLFYRLLLARDTFHRFNRVGILVMIALSVVIPFIRFSVETPVIAQQTVWDLEHLLLLASLVGETSVVETPLWIRCLLWAYVAGALFFLFLFLSSCFGLFRLVRGERRIEKLDRGITLIITARETAPFSWMRWIVISEKDLQEGGEAILLHERAHIESRHSLDLLFAELCILFHWFNPAIWLFKQELQNIHEYEADEKVIQKGIDAKKYQLLLIKKAVGSQRFTSMANSFNHRSLKKRISMMLKRKSSPWARLKYFFVLPLAALAVAAFARPEISNELEKISSVKINEIVPLKEIAGQESEKTKVQTQAQARDTIRIKPVTTRVDPVVEVELNQLEIEQEVGKQKQLKGKIKQVKQKQLKEETKQELEKQKQLKEETAEEKQSQFGELSKQLLIPVDGVETEGIQQIKPEDIESITILKDASAVEIYGEKGKNGVILITTKDADKKMDL